MDSDDLYMAGGQEDHTPEPIASVSDAASGLANAKTNNLPRNKYTGNNMLSTRAVESGAARIKKN